MSEQELKRDIFYWVHWCLSDADFQAALRSTYSEEQIGEAIAEIEAWFQQWLTP